MLRAGTVALMAAAMVMVTGCDSDSGVMRAGGRVEVDDIRVGSKIGGRVARVHFEEGEPVTAGETVVSLDDRETRAQQAEASATLSQAKSRLDLMLAGTRKEDLEQARAVVAAREAELELRRKGFRPEEIAQAEAQLAQAVSDEDLARKELERAQELRKQGAVEEREVDQRRTIDSAAKAQLEIARQRVALVRSGSRPEEISMAEAQLAQARAELDRLTNGARPEEIAAERAAVAAAEANVERIEAQLAEMLIQSPEDAIVETLDLEPGDLVRAGQPVAVLNLMKSPWVRAYVDERDLGALKPGDKVDIEVDGFDERRFKGVVRRLAREAEFTPRNVQTQEKRADLVFEVKVDVTEGGEDLRAGMYADVLAPRHGSGGK